MLGTLLPEHATPPVETCPSSITYSRYLAANFLIMLALRTVKGLHMLRLRSVDDTKNKF
jgi:hypothetical protein